MMTNYELLQFLAADGKYYTAQGHLALFERHFPDANIDRSRVSSVRAAIRESVKVTYKSKPVTGNKLALRVISVSPDFLNYAQAKSKDTHIKITDSYFRCGHETEIRAIKLRRQFDQLLSECRGHNKR